MSNIDFLKIINKPWLDIDDIKQIANCGDSSARKIIKEIESSIVSSGKKLPPSKRKLVPTNLVLDYLCIDLNYIVKNTTVQEEYNYVSETS